MSSQSERQSLLRSLEHSVTVEHIITVCGPSSSEDESDDEESFSQSSTTSSASADDSDSSNSSTTSTSSCSSDEDLLNSAEFLKVLLESQRYLSPRTLVPKTHEFITHLGKLDECRFRQEMRMSRSAFIQLFNMLDEHSVFYNNSSHRQVSVEVQLLIALYRFGCYGNAGSIGRVARRFGVSEGSVHLYTDRVIVAVLSLESKYVYWPSTEEKVAIKARIQESSAFPNCVGFVDGTLAVLQTKPSLEGTDYHSRKSSYGLSVMIVCDDQRRIRYIFAGFCGSVHDNRVFKGSKLGQTPEMFLENGEYLLADSGYTTTTDVIASYKKPLALLSDNVSFNFRLSSKRMTVEHTIGIYKGRFQCLRGLRIQIKNKKDHRRAVYWIRSCAVLHNFLIEDWRDDSWEKVTDIQNQSSGSGRDSEDNDQAGREKREHIKRIVLDEWQRRHDSRRSY